LRITPWNLRFHELIGLEVEVLRHLDPGLVGVRGVVEWETPRALLVSRGERRILILKSGALFAFHIPGGGRVVVPGDDILGGPAQRVKRLRR